jgi:hypothetical protein
LDILTHVYSIETSLELLARANHIDVVSDRYGIRDVDLLPNFPARYIEPYAVELQPFSARELKNRFLEL